MGDPVGSRGWWLMEQVRAKGDLEQHQHARADNRRHADFLQSEANQMEPESLPRRLWLCHISELRQRAVYFEHAAFNAAGRLELCERALAELEADYGDEHTWCPMCCTTVDVPPGDRCERCGATTGIVEREGDDDGQ